MYLPKSLAYVWWNLNELKGITIEKGVWLDYKFHAQHLYGLWFDPQHHAQSHQAYHSSLTLRVHTVLMKSDDLESFANFTMTT